VKPAASSGYVSLAQDTSAQGGGSVWRLGHNNDFHEPYLWVKFRMGLATYRYDRGPHSDSDHDIYKISTYDGMDATEQNTGNAGQSNFDYHQKFRNDNAGRIAGLDTSQPDYTDEYTTQTYGVIPGTSVAGSYTVQNHPYLMPYFYGLIGRWYTYYVPPYEASEEYQVQVGVNYYQQPVYETRTRRVTKPGQSGVRIHPGFFYQFFDESGSFGQYDYTRQYAVFYYEVTPFEIKLSEFRGRRENNPYGGSFLYNLSDTRLCETRERANLVGSHNATLVISFSHRSQAKTVVIPVTVQVRECPAYYK
jgi:hypothetical protein